jgi:hypothetical protein
LKVNSWALTPSEVALLSEPFEDHAGGPIVRCYYCSREGSTETTVLADGESVSRWVCVEHVAHRLRTSCYYCAREDAAETTVLKDGEPVLRWVCAEHAAHPPKRAGGVSTRLRRVVRSSSKGGSRTNLLRRR